jgi:hypothetical protein
MNLIETIKGEPMPTHNRRSTDNDVIVQEIDDFIAGNQLTPLEKLNLRVTKHNYVNGKTASKHVGNAELHTAKGLLVKTGVIGWFVFIMILVSTIVMYIPDGIALLKSLP